MKSVDQVNFTQVLHLKLTQSHLVIDQFISSIQVPVPIYLRTLFISNNLFELSNSGLLSDHAIKAQSDSIRISWNDNDAEKLLIRVCVKQVAIYRSRGLTHNFTDFNIK
jgi:hypothetical protein